MDGDGFAGRQGGLDNVVCEGDGGLRGSSGDADGGGFLGSIHF
jgi:hypothetical protein